MAASEQDSQMAIPPLPDEVSKAIKKGELERVIKFIDTGKLNIKRSRNQNGQTALHLAAYHGQSKLVSFFLDHGADVDAVDKHNWTALCLAACLGFEEVVNILLASEANKESRVKGGYTALHEAAYNGHLDIINILIEAGCDTTVKSDKGETVFDLANKYQYENKLTAFDVALLEGLESVAIELLLAGDDPNYMYDDGMTPLHIAAEYGLTNLVAQLWNYIDIDITNQEGQTALYVALLNGKKNVATTLIAEGADLNIAGKDGRTALHIALHNAYEDIATQLLNKGADPNLTENDGKKALHIAAYWGFTELVNTLLTRDDIDIDERDEKGRTPLHFALLNGKADTAQRLLEKGANSNLEDHEGRTAAQIAMDKGLSKLFTDHGYVDVHRFCIQRELWHKIRGDTSTFYRALLPDFTDSIAQQIGSLLIESSLPAVVTSSASDSEPAAKATPTSRM